MNDHALFFPLNGKLKPIATDKIMVIEASSNYSIVYTKDQAFTIALQLHSIERKLPTGMFCRVHRQYIISLHNICSIDRNYVEIIGKKIPIGETFQNDFLQKLIVLR